MQRADGPSIVASEVMTTPLPQPSSITTGAALA